jgi:NADH dehydrogenase FAD-containing subunit
MNSVPRYLYSEHRLQASSVLVEGGGLVGVELAAELRHRCAVHTHQCKNLCMNACGWTC